MCFGDLNEPNVSLYDLKSTLSSYRSQGYRFIYFNVGILPANGSGGRTRKEMENIYDAIIDVQDLREEFIDGLQSLLILLIRDMGFVSNRLAQIRG